MDLLRFELTDDRTRTLVWRGDELVASMPVFAGGETPPAAPAPTDPAPAPAPADPAPAPAPSPTDPAPAAPKAGDDPDDPDDPDADPDDKPLTAKESRRLRKENQRRREENERLTQSFDSLKSTIAKGLGLQKDDDDPETLKKSLGDVTKERDDSNDTVRSLRLEMAVGKAARDAGASEGLTWAYLNSHNKLTNIDIASDGYEDEVVKVVQSAIEAEPNLKVGQRPPSSGPDFRRGRTPEGQPKNLEDAVAAHYGDKA